MIHNVLNSIRYFWHKRPHTGKHLHPRLMPPLGKGICEINASPKQTPPDLILKGLTGGLSF